MTDDAIENEQRFANLKARTAESQLGTVEDADWANELVTVVFADGVRQTMGWTGDAPWEGDKVRVITASQRPFCQAIWPPAIGTVDSVTGDLATVTLDGGRRVTFPFIGVVPGGGDRVNVSHAARVIIGTPSTEPPGSEFIPPPRPPSGGGHQTIRFLAIGSANYRSGAVAGQALEVSDSRSAFVFYGRQVLDTIPAGASNVYAELVLSEVFDQVPSTPSKLGTHGSGGGVPGSPPGINLTGALSIADGGAINVTSLIPQFRAGTAFGFALPAGFGWRQFAALPDLWVSFDT